MQVPRTILSAQANLWSLYPPSSRTDGEVSAVEINVIERPTDDLHPNPNICPEYATVWRFLFM